MEAKSKSRVTMLALSGVLFGVSAFGWMIHRGSTPEEQQPAATPSQANLAPSTVQSPVAEVQATPTPTAVNVYPSTRMEDAVREAHAMLRKDPMAPIHTDVPAQSQRIAYAPTRRTYHRGGSYVPPPPEARLLDPPAANDPSLYGARNAYLPAPMEVTPQRPNKLSARDIRLVGLIDGKAIFKVNADVAKQLMLPSAFTLGKGETFSNIRVDNVSTENATVHDGHHVATKALEAVH